MPRRQPSLQPLDEQIRALHAQRDRLERDLDEQRGRVLRRVLANLPLAARNAYVGALLLVKRHRGLTA